jgi:hypothetical protein
MAPKVQITKSKYQTISKFQAPVTEPFGQEKFKYYCIGPIYVPTIKSLVVSSRKEFFNNALNLEASIDRKKTQKSHQIETCFRMPASRPVCHNWIGSECSRRKHIR